MPYLTVYVNIVFFSFVKKDSIFPICFTVQLSASQFSLLIRALLSVRAGEASLGGRSMRPSAGVMSAGTLRWYRAAWSVARGGAGEEQSVRL